MVLFVVHLCTTKRTMPVLLKICCALKKITKTPTLIKVEVFR